MKLKVLLIKLTTTITSLRCEKEYNYNSLYMNYMYIPKIIIILIYSIFTQGYLPCYFI